MRWAGVAAACAGAWQKVASARRGVGMKALVVAWLTLGLPQASAAGAETNGLAIELNSAQTEGSACRLTFVLTNAFDQDIEALVAEAVLFSRQGGLVLLTLFDFGAVPAGRSLVRRFAVQDSACNALGQVLINGFDKCQIAGKATSSCEKALGLSSRVAIRLEG